MRSGTTLETLQQLAEREDQQTKLLEFKSSRIGRKQALTSVLYKLMKAIPFDVIDGEGGDMQGRPNQLRVGISLTPPRTRTLQMATGIGNRAGGS